MLQLFANDGCFENGNRSCELVPNWFHLHEGIGNFGYFERKKKKNVSGQIMEMQTEKPANSNEKSLVCALKNHFCTRQ